MSGTGDPAAPSWDAVLDELEGALATSSAWEPPAGLPPLPARLLGRAELLLERQQELQRELAAERERVAGELSATRRLPQPPRSAAPAAGGGLSL